MKILFLSGILIISSVTPTAAQPTDTDSVTVTFEIIVPKSTPAEATIFWTGSLNRWDPGDEGKGVGPKDYSRSATFRGEKWVIELTALRGSEESYKYTRGSIYSTEERADFTYRTPRKVVFDQPKTVRDTVEAWHDIPPKALVEAWPIIKLEKAEINIAYHGIILNGMSSILYDKAIGSRFFDFIKTNTTVKNIPDSFHDAVYYYQKVSPISDNLQLIAAAKTRPEGPWHIFVDINGDKSISTEEKVISIREDNQQTWTGLVSYHRMENGKTVTDSVELTIKHAADLPAGYRSSVNPDAPDLTYKLPFKHHKGTINGHPFFVTTSYQNTFRDFYQLTIDRNNNDTLEIGSGSNEVYAMDLAKMYRQQKFYLYPAFKLGDQFWQVANISPTGKWIRLRPAQKTDMRKQIAEGKPAPEWKAVTIGGDTLSSESLRGKFVLLDFWGSWCGPCIEEIPLLKKIYHRFKSENFKMIGFAYESEQSLDRAMKKYRLPWPQVLDSNGHHSSTFLVRGYPTHYLIGPKGKVLEMGSALDGKQLISTLEKYLE